jgi:hypothetical protein
MFINIYLRIYLKVVKTFFATETILINIMPISVLFYNYLRLSVKFLLDFFNLKNNKYNYELLYFCKIFPYSVKLVKLI